MYRVVPCTSRLQLNADWFAYTQNKETSLANDQLDAHILICSVHVHISNNILLILRRSNCINPLNAELNPICPLLALFRAHLILHVSR
jgi:hypothetical protein